MIYSKYIAIKLNFGGKKMKTVKKPLAVVIALSLLLSTLIIGAAFNASAATALTADAVKWVNWSNQREGSEYFDNFGTHLVSQDDNGVFGNGVGEVDFTSDNTDMVAEHMFGNSIWGTPDSLFDSSQLVGKTGLEMLVNIEVASTSSKWSIKLASISSNGNSYTAVVSAVKGSTVLVQIPFTAMKLNTGKPLTDFSDLSGCIAITDGWDGYPVGHLGTWNCKFSDVYSYGDNGTTTPAKALVLGFTPSMNPVSIGQIFDVTVTANNVPNKNIAAFS